MLKKVSWYSISLVIILLVFSFPLIHRGVWITHDGQNHIARFAGYFQAFHDMQFPPRWAKNLNYTYGSPVLMFFYPLPGYFASILHLLGISFEDSFKVLAFISFILAPVHFYLWISRVVKKSIVAWIGALLYGLAPYHLLDIYVRGDIGELLAFVFIPLVFFAIERFLQTKQIYFILLGSIFYALLMLSHNGISLLFTPILIVYSWMKSDDKKTFFSLGMLFIIGLMLSSFFWIPVLYERRYLHAALFIGDIYRLNFPILQQLIYSAWGFGSEVSKSGGLSPQIGILPFILILTSVLYFPFCKKKMYFGFWIVIFLIFFFLDLQESILIWQRVSLLKLLEFPWRLVAISSFSGAVIVCYLFDQIANPKIIIVFAIFFVASISPFSKVQGYTYKSDAYYLKFPGTTYFYGEASTLWTAGDAGAYPRKAVEIISGDAKIISFSKKTQLHSLFINAKTLTKLVDNTVFFPGWLVFVDGITTPIEFQDPNYRGLITFAVPQGKHHVAISFVETFDRKITDMISLSGWIIVFALLAQQSLPFIIKKSRYAAHT